MNVVVKTESIIVQALSLLKKPTCKSHKMFKKKSEAKRRYIKFAPKKLDVLLSFYATNRYPSRDEMLELSEQFKESFSKIENWFKHKRRTEVKKGAMKFTKKKVFTKLEMEILMKYFLQFKKPNMKKYREIAQELNCDLKHVKNWFSYKRKLLLKIKKGTYFGSMSQYHLKSLKEKCQQIFPEERKKTEEEKNKILKERGESLKNILTEKKKEGFDKLKPNEACNLNPKIENQNIEFAPKFSPENYLEVSQRFPNYSFMMMNNKFNAQDYLMKMNMYYKQMVAYKQMNIIIENEMLKRQLESIRYHHYIIKNMEQ